MRQHQLTQKELMALTVVSLLVLVLGVVLYTNGNNESLYSGSEAVRDVFEALTELGNQGLYLVVLTLVYLSYDKGFGRRLCLLFFFMVYLTAFLKQFFHDPRPPANAERDDPYRSFGFPSGHTTTSITFYGYILFNHLGRDRMRLTVTLLCVFAMVAVPISRLVIGVHDVQDVAGGAVVALSALIAFMVLMPRLAPLVKAWPLGVQLGMGVPLTLLLWLMGSVVLALRHPGDLLVAMEELSMGAGLLLGCAIAFPLEEALVGYRPDLMDLKGRVLAGVLGIPSTIIVYGVMSWVSGSLLPEHLADVLTFTVFIIVLALVVPMIMVMYIDRGVARGPDESGG